MSVLVLLFIHHNSNLITNDYGFSSGCEYMFDFAWKPCLILYLLLQVCECPFYHLHTALLVELPDFQEVSAFFFLFMFFLIPLLS